MSTVRKLPSRPIRHAAPTQKSGTPTIDELLRIMTSLVGLLEEENTLLAKGMPTNLTGTVDAKERLAAKFRELFLSLDLGRPLEVAEDKAALKELTEKAEAIRSLSAQNMAFLQSAHEASIRRVEAVMNALKGDKEARRPWYGQASNEDGSPAGAFSDRRA